MGTNEYTCRGWGQGTGNGRVDVLLKAKRCAAVRPCTIDRFVGRAKSFLIEFHVGAVYVFLSWPGATHEPPPATRDPRPDPRPNVVGAAHIGIMSRWLRHCVCLVY